MFTKLFRPLTSKTTLLLAAAALAGCAASDNQGSGTQAGTGGGGTTTDLCTPNQQVSCACPGGVEGFQTCDSDGAGFEMCVCGDGSGGSGAGDPCGDGMCAMDENCHTCEADCGECAPCEIAPSCENSAIPPTNVVHATDLDVPKMDWVTPNMLEQRLLDAVANAGDATRILAAALDNVSPSDEHPLVTSLREIFANHPKAATTLRKQLSDAGMGSPAQYRNLFPERRIEVLPVVTPKGDEFPGGTVECGAPLLRITVEKIKVHEEDDDLANDIVYCVIQSETMNGGEIRVTPKTPNLDEGDEYNFALESGVFWGQQEALTPGGNILVTYDCIEADTSDGYQNLINAIGDAASQIGDVIPGDSGWIFTTVGALAPIVSGGLALDGDDHLFNAQQTIPLDRQLELTNGAFWTVRRDGTHVLSDWDWELFIKAWGCAEYGTL